MNLKKAGLLMLNQPDISFALGHVLEVYNESYARSGHDVTTDFYKNRTTNTNDSIIRQ